MKRTILIISFISLTIAGFAQNAPEAQPKYYPVYHTLQEWQIIINAIDSKATSQMLISQLNALIEQEKKKEEAKADSVKKAPPKKP